MITTINEFKALDYIKNIFNKEQYILRKKTDDALSYTYLQYSNNYGRTFNHIAGYPYGEAEKKIKILIDKYKLDTLDGLRTYVVNDLKEKQVDKDSYKKDKKGIKVPLKEFKIKKLGIEKPKQKWMDEFDDVKKYEKKNNMMKHIKKFKQHNEKIKRYKKHPNHPEELTIEIPKDQFLKRRITQFGKERDILYLAILIPIEGQNELAREYLHSIPDFTIEGGDEGARQEIHDNIDTALYQEYYTKQSVDKDISIDMNRLEEIKFVTHEQKSLSDIAGFIKKYAS